MAVQLELRHELGGPRHYLAGEPVHASDILEFRDEKTGAWKVARYEWNYRQQDTPVLFISEDEGVCVNPAMQFRWPEPSRNRF